MHDIPTWHTQFFRQVPYTDRFCRCQKPIELYRATIHSYHIPYQHASLISYLTNIELLTSANLCKIPQQSILVESSQWVILAPTSWNQKMRKIWPSLSPRRRRDRESPSLTLNQRGRRGRVSSCMTSCHRPRRKIPLTNIFRRISRMVQRWLLHKRRRCKSPSRSILFKLKWNTLLSHLIWRLPQS